MYKRDTKMIIDGHAHASGDFLKPENIIDNLDKSGVDKVILVPGELESTKNYSLPNLRIHFSYLYSSMITVWLVLWFSQFVSRRPSAPLRTLGICVSGRHNSADRGDRYPSEELRAICCIGNNTKRFLPRRGIGKVCSMKREATC